MSEEKLVKHPGKGVKNIKWDERQVAAAIMLAEGHPKVEIYEKLGIERSTLWRWEQNEEFATEVDKLSLMYGLASKAKRMREINRIALMFDRALTHPINEGYTYLDLLKEARMQSEGVRLDILSTLTAITTETGSVERLGPGEGRQLPDPDDTETQ